MPLALCFNEPIWQCRWKLANYYVLVTAAGGLCCSQSCNTVFCGNTYYNCIHSSVGWTVWKGWCVIFIMTGFLILVTTIFNLTLHRKIQGILYMLLLLFYNDYSSIFCFSNERNSLDTCTTICSLFIWSPVTSSLVVSGTSGAVWPESRNITQDLSRGLNWPLWAVIGRTHQKDQSGQAQNHCCRHPQCRGVSLLGSYEIYLPVPHQSLIVFQHLDTLLNFSCRGMSRNIVHKPNCRLFEQFKVWIVSNKAKTTIVLMTLVSM